MDRFHGSPSGATPDGSCRWLLVMTLVLVLFGPVLAKEVYVDIDEQPEGQTYGRWAAAWWEWGFEVPGANNPLVDMTGAYCGERQAETDVWFLAGFLGDPGGPVVRECTVPEGRFLFFPLVNSAYAAFLNDPPEQRTEEFLREAARCQFGVELFLELDGEEVAEDKDLQKLFTGETGSLSPLFNTQLPPGNLFGLTEAIVPELAFSPMAEQGYYIMLRPLAPGEHTIHWVASGCGDPGFTQDITYFLTVDDGVDSGSATDDATSASSAEDTSARGGIRFPQDLGR